MGLQPALCPMKPAIVGNRGLLAGLRDRHRKTSSPVISDDPVLVYRMLTVSGCNIEVT